MAFLANEVMDDNLLPTNTNMNTISPMHVIHSMLLNTYFLILINVVRQRCVVDMSRRVYVDVVRLVVGLLPVTAYSVELEKDVVGDTSGDFRRLLISLLQAKRSDSAEFDRDKVRQDARALFEAGEGKWGTDESKFNVILVWRSYAQLRAIFEEYRKISKKDIEQVLKSELSGDLLRGLKSIGEFV